MTEIHEPGVIAPVPKQRRKVRASDIVIIGLLLIVVIWLTIFIVKKVQLHNEVSEAKIVTDAVVADLAKQDTAALRALGDKQFQAKNSASSLSSHLTATDQDGNKITFSQLYGKTTPKIDRQIVANNSRGKHVVIIYRYDKLKAPLFVRVDSAKASNSSKWTLQAFSVSPDESKLIGG